MGQRRIVMEQQGTVKGKWGISMKMEYSHGTWASGAFLWEMGHCNGRL